jgi:hypothetical protein
MKYKNYLALILAIVTVVTAGYYLKVFADGTVHYGTGKPDCE